MACTIISNVDSYVVYFRLESRLNIASFNNKMTMIDCYTSMLLMWEHFINYNHNNSFDLILTFVTAVEKITYLQTSTDPTNNQFTNNKITHCHTNPPTTTNPSTTTIPPQQPIHHVNRSTIINRSQHQPIHQHQTDSSTFNKPPTSTDTSTSSIPTSSVTSNSTKSTHQRYINTTNPSTSTNHQHQR